MRLMADTESNRTLLYPRLYALSASSACVGLGMAMAPLVGRTLPFSMLAHLIMPILAAAAAVMLYRRGSRLQHRRPAPRPVLWAGSRHEIVQNVEQDAPAADYGPGVVGRVRQLVDGEPVALVDHDGGDDGQATVLRLRATKPGLLSDASAADRLIKKILASIEGGTHLWSAEMALSSDTLTVRKKTPFPKILYPPTDAAVVTDPRQVVARWEEDPMLVFGRDAHGRDIAVNLTKQPHGLVIGGTGSGKSVFTRGTIEDLRRRGAMFCILDGKKVDYQRCRDLPNVLMVASDEDDWVRIVDYVEDQMEKRYAESARRSELGLEPVFNSPPMLFLIDEFGSVVRSLTARYGKQGMNAVFNKLRNIAAKGRQCRIHIILATQEIYADTIPGDMQENFSYVVSLGVPGRNTMQTAFSSEVRMEAKRIGDSIAQNDKGRGVAEIKDDKGSRVVEFQTFYGYSPADNNPPFDETTRREWDAFKHNISDRIPKMYPRMYYEKRESKEMLAIAEECKSSKDLSALLELPMVALESYDAAAGVFRHTEGTQQWDPLSPQFVGAARADGPVEDLIGIPQAVDAAPATPAISAAQAGAAGSCADPSDAAPQPGEADTP